MEPTSEESSKDRIRKKLAENLRTRRAAVESTAPPGTDPATYVCPWFGKEKKEVPREVTGSKLTRLGDVTPYAGDYRNFMIHVYDETLYSDEYRALIPPIKKFKNYRPNAEVLYQMAYCLETGEQPVMAITGDPSVGKTSITEYFAALTRRPWYRFQHNPRNDVGDLIGVKEVKDGETRFNTGEITRAIQAPNAILIHDEGFSMDPGTALCMHGVLEKDGKLMLPEMDGESSSDRYVIPHWNLAHIFLDNTEGQGDMTGRFVGTQPQNAALLDRIDMFVKMSFMTVEEEVEALQLYYPDARTQLLRACCKVAKLSRSAHKQGTVSTILSFRVLLQWVKNAIALRDVRKSLDMCMLNRFSEHTEAQIIEGFVDIEFGEM